MHAQRVLLLLLLAVLICPLGVTAQKPTPEETNILEEEATPAETGLVADEPAPADAGTVSPVCGTASGTRFNLEPRPNASPQHTQTVDLLRNRVAAGVDLVVGGSTDLRGSLSFNNGLTGYYVSRDADCSAEFEGRLPYTASADFYGGGRPVVAADPARDVVFMADLRTNGAGAVVGVGLFRTTAATLLNTTACPTGTHTAAQAATCWPTKRFIPQSALGGPDGPLRLAEFHLTVDERTSGTGAGNVYLVSTGLHENLDAYVITLMTCTNTLTTCSAATIIYADAPTEQIRPHGAVRPDGRITLTWIRFENLLPYNVVGLVSYRSCAPAVPPAVPTCGAVRLVAGISNRVLVASTIATYPGVTTHPKHDHRQDANGTETYVVWDQCKVDVTGVPYTGKPPYPFCPDADVVMAASRNDGATWSAPTCVSCGGEDQFLPTIKTDRSRNIVNIAFYGSGSDPTFQRRARLFLAHINPGAATPDPVTDIHTLTTLLNDLEAGPPLSSWTFELGGAIRGFAEALGYIGLAARGTGADGGSRTYVHFTYNNIQGLYSGIPVPELNNHLSRLDY